MTSPLASLYTELVMEHDKRPLHAGLREPFDTEVHHVNPTCGDEITLRLHLAGSGEQLWVTDLSYEAIGCAMSRASASIMSDLLIGRTITEILPVQAHFEAASGARGGRPGDQELSGAGGAPSAAGAVPP